MITSSSSRQIKNAAALIKKAKERRVQGLFVIEGPKMFAEAPAEWINKIYAGETFFKEQGTEIFRGMQYEVVSDSVLNSISDTKTPQGILAVLKKPEYKLEELLAGKQTHLLILESIQDPGNLGTMLRAGEGAGITGIIFNRTTADLFAPKTIRSTMGSIYRVPYYETEDLIETIRELKGCQITVYAAHPAGSVVYDACDYTAGGSAFLIGNEGNGLSEETVAMADIRIRIPMQGAVESLNAGVSAALLMYEVQRQKRRFGGCDENMV